MSHTKLATFQVGGLLLGIDVIRVQEVLGAEQIIPVPNAPAGVLGLVNLRGQIIAAIDLRQRLGLPPSAPEASIVHVILRTGRQLESLVVDLEGEVLNVDLQQREDIPDTVDPLIHDLITGVYLLNEQLLLALDVDKALRGDYLEGQVTHASTGH